MRSLAQVGNRLGTSGAPASGALTLLPGNTRPVSFYPRHRRPHQTAGNLDAMRAAAWHRHGVAALPIQDIADPWLRQAITNEANRRWGRRQGGHCHGR